MENKKELIPWQKNIVAEYGLLVFIISSGQVRRYGPTINEYEVIDVYQQYNKDQILDICCKHIDRADLPVSSTLHLSQSVLDFKKIGYITYYYKCGHDYTD